MFFDFGKSKKLSILLLGGSLLGASGCKVGPDYRRPDIKLNTEYTESLENFTNFSQVGYVSSDEQLVQTAEFTENTNKKAKKEKKSAQNSVSEAGYKSEIANRANSELIKWWETLHDPLLNSLMAEAFVGAKDRTQQRSVKGKVPAGNAGKIGNISLREMYWRIQQSRAQVGVVKSELFPQIAADGSYSANKVAGFSDVTDRWSLGTSMSWEIDLFGRLRNYTEAAWADLATQEELYRDLSVILSANIATQYVNVRLYQNQIDIAKKNIEIRRNTLRLTEELHKVIEKSSNLDVSQARASLASVEAELPLLYAQHRAALNRLSVLLGKPPGYVDEMLREMAPLPVPPESIMVGIPADLIRRRPDIRAVEQRLVAQNARIGASKGDLYPILSLNGSFGVEAANFKDLWNSENIRAGVGPSFRWNILNFGRIRSNIRAKEFGYEELVASYELAILQAAEEVDNSISSYVNEKQRLAKLREAVQSYEMAFAISEERYRNGTSDFQRVLDSQREKLSFELQQKRSEAQAVIDVINLYRALGGGYNETNINASPLPK
ncbi:MAG: efflux transporter outer membrane subunit [Thermoguttaceae bacterium]